MARFDVYRNSGQHASRAPYLLDVQSDLLDGLGSCMVIPIRRVTNFPNVKLPERLTAIVLVSGERMFLETPKMGAVPRHVLTRPVASLADEKNRITAALDFLFQGY